MKITIKNKTIDIPVTSSLYREIKTVLVEASEQNPNYHIHTGDILGGETYRKYMRDYDMSGPNGTAAQNKGSGISSQDIHDQLHAHHLASAAMNKTMARMYTSHKKENEDLARAHENMAKSLHKNHEYQKTVY